MLNLQKMTASDEIDVVTTVKLLMIMLMTNVVLMIMIHHLCRFVDLYAVPSRSDTSTELQRNIQPRSAGLS
jgi:hypothetical protein